METVKIDFCDFWAGFDKWNNYFYKILSKKYKVEISENPHILFFSCFGTKHVKYKCHKVFYSGENRVTDFNGCDFSITFEDLKNANQYKLPYYAFRILELQVLDRLLEPISLEESLKKWKAKTKFASFVVTNGKAKERIHFFEKLSDYKRVDSGGRHLNNIEQLIKDKIEFISDYKFNIAFENERFPGYLTEKLVDAFLADTIPIYWGDPFVKNVFNAKRFIDASDFVNYDELINEIKDIEHNENRAAGYLSAPIFANRIPPELDEKKFENFLSGIIDCRLKTVPVAQTNRRFLYRYKLIRKGIYKNYMKAIVKLKRCSSLLKEKFS